MRTHLCAAVTAAAIDQEVTVAGWVAGRRDHGGVIFVDLRDRSGRVQVVADPESPAAFNIAEQSRNEFVLRITGGVRRRPIGTQNAELPNGDVEIVAAQIEILNRAAALPFQLDDESVSEAVRLQYRFLDLRRAPMQNALRMRHQTIRALREFLDAREFTEVETPMLTRSTPEGARDYLVPSRVRQGAFFALPQSPQLFKQLLMCGGVERYYQIARCFRDEDLRADRQPEFTQLDIEMAFVDEATVMNFITEMIRHVFARAAEVELPAAFARISYAEATAKYGSDRPDLRVDLELCELTEFMRAVEFKVFSAPAQHPDGRVAALKIPGGGEQLTRAQIDHYTEFVKTYRAKGLAYIKVLRAACGREGLQSPILKFLTDDVLRQILATTAATDGDLIFFGADHKNIVNDSLGALRLKIAQDLNLIQRGWRPLWVTDFPLVERDANAGRWTALHHPFTAPREEDIDLLTEAPAKVRARAYDLVVNGVEIGGGSIRMHQAELQLRVLKLLGVGEAQARAEFGFLLDALRYGAPPHGGIAFGIDRLAAMLIGADSIREVIAFPKTQQAACMLTGAPDEIAAAQLRELGLQIRRRHNADAAEE